MTFFVDGKLQWITTDCNVKTNIKKKHQLNKSKTAFQFNMHTDLNMIKQKTFLAGLFGTKLGQRHRQWPILYLA